MVCPKPLKSPVPRPPVFEPVEKPVSPPKLLPPEVEAGVLKFPKPPRPVAVVVTVEPKLPSPEKG